MDYSAIINTYKADQLTPNNRVYGSRSDQVNQKLQALVQQYEQGRPVQVDFRKLVDWVPYSDKYTHYLHSYPAKLLKHIPIFFLHSELNPKGGLVMDPFCGTGTVLLESMMCGNNSIGFDANPIARLISRVKTTPIKPFVLKRALFKVLVRAKQFRKPLDLNVTNIDHWFPKHVQIDLSRLNRAIEELNKPEVREFYEVVFSSIIKKCSYSDPNLSVPVKIKPEKYKNKEFKKRAEKQLASIKTINVFELFEKQAELNIQRMEELVNLKLSSNADVAGNDARCLKINGKKVSNEDISDCEQAHALYLLSNFMFFGVREIREMLKSAYRDKVKNPLTQKVRMQNNNSTIQNIIENGFNEQLASTRFLGIGNPSESGTHLLYFFRQENCLNKELFIHSHQILEAKELIEMEAGERQLTVALRSENVNRYVFIDDVCGSGTQAAEYSKELLEKIKELREDIELHYIVLFSTSDGLKYVKDNTVFDKVDCIFELDNTYKCFSENSRYFQSNMELPVSRDFAKAFCRKYGLAMLFPEEHALGYKDGQLLLGFSHNIPDNTLPIIWDEYHNWTPIFKRYAKLSSNIYG